MTTPRVPGSKIAAAKSSTTKPRRRRQYRVRQECGVNIWNSIGRVLRYNESQHIGIKRVNWWWINFVGFHGSPSPTNLHLEQII